MALALDATSNKATFASSGTSFTWNHTCSGSNRVLVVLVGMVTTTSVPTSVTYNGTAMTLICFARDNGGSEMRNYIYVLVAPSTGTNAIVVNVSATLGSDFGSGAAISFTGAHQTYPYRLPWPGYSGNPTGTTIQQTATDALTGDYVVGTAIAHQATMTQDAGQTAINTWNAWNAGQNTSWATAYKAASGSTFLKWTQTAAVWSCAIVAIRPDTDSLSAPVADNIGQNGQGIVNAVGVNPSTTTVTIPNFVVSTDPTSQGLLLVNVQYDTGTANTGLSVSGITFNTTSTLTKLDSQRMTESSRSFVSEIWYLKAPPVATANIVITMSASAEGLVAGASSWWNVNQGSSPTTATGTFGTVAKASSTTAASMTVNVTTQVGAVVVDSLTNDFTLELFYTGFPMWNLQSGAAFNSGGFSQVKSGSASAVTMNWTGDTNPFSIVAVGINGPSSATFVPEDDTPSRTWFSAFDNNVTVWQ